MRHAKQFLYGIFYLIIWLGIASGVYYIFIKPAPTCYDGIQNQSEAGVDCGGVCAKQCLPALAPLSAGDVSVLPLFVSPAGSRVSLVTEVKNSNPDWGAQSFAYTFHVYDSGDKEIGAFSGSSYIYGGEIKNIAVVNQQVSGVPASATVVLTDPAWKKSLEFAAPSLTVNLTRTDRDQVITARGTVTNTGALNANVDLLALFYDAGGILRGASLGALKNIAPQGSSEFAILHPILDTIAPERTRVFAYGYSVQ